jgi:hypothetical protein
MFAPMIAALREGVAHAGGDRQALAALAAELLRGLFGNILSNADFRWQVPIMVREFQDPSAAFEMLLRERIDPVHDAIGGLVAAATGHAPGAPETRLLTASVMGQCMSFAAARGVIFARLGWADYTPERIDFVIDTLVPRMLAMLGLPDGPPAMAEKET